MRRERWRAAAAPAPASAPLEVPADLFERLRQWRLEEARRRRIPAFRIVSDRTLEALAFARPRSEDELLAIHGIGPAKADDFGAAILAVLSASTE